MPGPAKKPMHLRAIAGTRMPKTAPKTAETPPPATDPAPPIPKKPSWLKDRFAAESWKRLAAYMTAQGTLNDGNLDGLASLCGVNGEIAQCRTKGQPVIPSLLAQQARLMLDLRLTGAHSGTGGPATPPTNPFARNGRRPA